MFGLQKLAAKSSDLKWVFYSLFSLALEAAEALGKFVGFLF